MPAIISFNPNRAVDINSLAVPGAIARFYDAGTTRRRTVYADPQCTVPHPWPLVADGAGVFPAAFDAGGRDVKVEVLTPDGVTLAGYPLDPARIVSTDVTGAVGVSFDPTTSIPETNVQAAIERVQANIVEPLAEYGLGVTGNAPALINIDASDIASGIYRYAGATAGTFPAGVTASDGGIVRLWRETANRCLMILAPGVKRRQYVRYYAGGSWSSWAYLIQSSDVAANAAWLSGSDTTPLLISPATLRTVYSSSDIGVGQEWQDVTASRFTDITYNNGSGKPIMVTVEAQNGRGQVSVTGSGGWVSVAVAQGNVDGRQFQSFIVPPTHRYRWSGASQIYTWSELR